MTKAFRTSILIAVLIIGFAISWWFVTRSDVPTVSGAFEGGNAGRTFLGTVLLAGYGFLITLVGVSLGSIYRRLIELKKSGVVTVHLATMLKEVGQSTDFLLALVGSPIVFGLLWQSLGDISTAGLTLIALQNGFSSHAILDQALSKVETKRTNGHS